MFSYKTFDFKYKLNIRHLSIFLTAVYVISLIPMLILGFYNFPSADDFSMALQTHQAYEDTGSIFKALLASLAKSWYVYANYEGYFFSIVLTDICPSSFSIKLYFLVPFIITAMLTFGVCYFFDALFVRVWKLDKHLTNSVAMLTLIMMIQCMPRGLVRSESFYWYSGAINYSFTFGMAFFWLGLLLRSIYDENPKSRKRKLFWSVFWGFWMGGANYLTALELAICSVLILFIFVMVKKGFFFIEGASKEQGKSFNFIWVPAVVNLIGFAFSCFSPGVAVRSAETNHYGPVKAVLLSLYSTFDMMTNDMLRWESMLVFVMLIPISWKLSDKLKQKLQHPFLFVLFAFLLVSSNMTPPYFATANIEAGRLKALGWMEFVVVMVLVVFYLTAWVRQQFEEKYGLLIDDDREGRIYSATSTLLILMVCLFIFIGSGLCVIPDPGYYMSTAALNSLVSGEAATYKAENLERLAILEDDSVRVAELKEHTVFPELLFYQDVTFDSGEWINTATATFFNKDEVYLLHNE